MTSQEASSKLRACKKTEYLTGSKTELVTIDGNPTTLFVFSGERLDSVQSFHSGDFTLNMVQSARNCPITMMTCMVGSHQWMLARDSLVASAGERRFVFGLPGFFYGMELGSGQLEHKYKAVESFFGRFCAFQDISQIEGPDDSTNPEGNPWIAAYNKIQKLTNLSSTIFGAPKPTPDLTNSDLTHSNKMGSAIRTSAVVKLLVRSLLNGVLCPSKHFQINPANTAMVALPTMWVVSDLLNACKTGRTTTNREAPGDHDGTACWHVNVEGMMFLLREVHALRAKKMATADAKRKREDEGGDNNRQEKGGSGGMKRPPCGGMSQVSGLRIGNCGKK